MPNAQGTIKQIWPNNGKPRVVLDNDMSVSAFKEAQLGGAAVGDVVSFAYIEKPYNGKTYYNLQGNLAVVSKNTAPQGQPQQNNTGPSGGTPTHFERNGAQVGAAINQAIQLCGISANFDMESIETTAKEFLAMGDRLLKFKGE